jgi:hypothetical protein
MIDTLSSVSPRTTNPENKEIGEPWIHLSKLLQDSENLREGLAWNAPSLAIAA